MGESYCILTFCLCWTDWLQRELLRFTAGQDCDWISQHSRAATLQICASDFRLRHSPRRWPPALWPDRQRWWQNSRPSKTGLSANQQDLSPACLRPLRNNIQPLLLSSPGWPRDSWAGLCVTPCRQSTSGEGSLEPGSQGPVEMALASSQNLRRP
jgi:hypothetical protein